MSKKADNKISESDLLLWLEVANNIKKLIIKKPKTKLATNKTSRVTVSAKEGASAHAPKTQIMHLTLGDLGHLDTKTLRKMNRGEMFIDAKLDLHGLTELQAFDKLASFVEDSFSSSYRLLLVITGKGNELKPSILKGRMDTWINTDKIAPFVIRFAHAAKRHGGDGAFYLYLRKNGAGCRI